VDEVVVVEGAHALAPVSDTCQTPVGQRSDMCQTHRHVRFARCEEWALGPGASLRCGLAALGAEVDRAVIVLADGPDLDPRAVERVLAAPEPYAVASYDGSRSHPVVLARSEWDGVPDEGLRGREPTLVDCSDLRPPGDVDYRR
jgi:CTP:molybdopterin cytidylyltransferase MocA